MALGASGLSVVRWSSRPSCRPGARLGRIRWARCAIS